MLSWRQETITNAVFATQPTLPTAEAAFWHAVPFAVCYLLGTLASLFRGGEEGEPSLIKQLVAVGKFFLRGAGKPWRPLACVVLAVAAVGSWMWPSVCCPAAWLAFREFAKWCHDQDPERQVHAERVEWWERLRRVKAVIGVVVAVIAVVFAFVAVGLCMDFGTQYAHLWMLRSFGQLSPAVGAAEVATQGAATAAAMAIAGEAVPVVAELALVPA